MRSGFLFQNRTSRWCNALLTTTAVVGLSVLAGWLSTNAFGQEQRTVEEVRQAVNLRPGDDKDRILQNKLSQNNLTQIGVALLAYHDQYLTFPPWAVCNKAGKPQLSWRVLILPHVNEEALQFKLEEPWDSAHNIKLLEKMPNVYKAPGIKTKEPGLTYYQGFVGKGAGWEFMPDPKALDNARGLKWRDFVYFDGASNTIAVLEAGEPVPWTKPADLAFEQGKPLPKIGGVFKDHANAVMFDGAVLSISQKVRPAMLEAAITRNGGEVLVDGWNEGK